MIKKGFHKVIAICSVLIALLPMNVQFAHAMENHGHDLCELQNIKHYHSNDIDCEFNHFLFNSNATLIGVDEQLQASIEVTSNPQFYSENTKGIVLYSTSSRAPPVFFI